MSTVHVSAHPLVRHKLARLRSVETKPPEFRDLVAATIYIVLFGLQIYVWVWWQKRGTKKTAAGELTSAYGRPLVKRS